MPSYYKAKLGMGKEKDVHITAAHILGHRNINVNRGSREWLGTNALP